MDSTAERMAEIDRGKLEQTLFYLTKDPLPYRKVNYTLPGHEKSTLDEADDFLVGELEGYGYRVEREACQVQASRRDRSKPKNRQYAPPDPADPWHTAYNLYAKKEGTAFPDEVIVAVSHKDSQSWVASPGAYDNAAGTAATLEIARVLSGYACQRSIWFVFCNEEHVPWTSVTAAENAAQAGTNIIAVLNIDSLGGKSAEDVEDGVRANVTRYTTPEGERIADLMAELNDRYKLGLRQRKFESKTPGDDDGSFIKAGFPAAVLCVGSYPYADPNYHAEDDSFENVDLPNVEMAAQISLAALVHLDMHGPPQARSCGAAAADIEGLRSFLSQVDQEELERNLFYLAKDPLPYRKANYTVPGHEKNTLDETDDFILGKLQSWGYDTDKEPAKAQAFRRDRSKRKSSQFSKPDPSDPWYDVWDVYGKKTGTARPDEIIMVLAHKDSMSWIDSPGAYDNGTGTITAMEVARVLREYESKRSIWFMFCNEEHRPWTSITAARNAADAGLNLIAVLNLDAIGGKSAEDVEDGVRSHVTRHTTPQGERIADLMTELNEKYGIGLRTGKYESQTPGDDDGSFIKAGFPAAVACIGSYPYADPNYHAEGDTPENVDLPNVRMATQLCLATVLHLDREGC